MSEEVTVDSLLPSRQRVRHTGRKPAETSWSSESHGPSAKMGRLSR